jgi:hypothetical protein
LRTKTGIIETPVIGGPDLRAWGVTWICTAKFEAVDTCEGRNYDAEETSKRTDLENGSMLIKISIPNSSFWSVAGEVVGKTWSGPSLIYGSLFKPDIWNPPTKLCVNPDNNMFWAKAAHETLILAILSVTGGK